VSIFLVNTFLIRKFTDKPRKKTNLMQEIIRIGTDRKNGLYEITEAMKTNCEMTESSNKSRQNLELSLFNKAIRSIHVLTFSY
jgi:hypothetical protein